MIYGLEDIKRNYEERSIRHTKDRTIWSYNNRPIRATRMGIRTHKDSLMKTFKQLIKTTSSLEKSTLGKDLPIADEGKDDLEEVSPAQRRARKAAYARKTMAKYGQARKMGIPASKVNQRRNTPTRTK